MELLWSKDHMTISLTKKVDTIESYGKNKARRARELLRKNSESREKRRSIRMHLRIEK